VLLKEYKEAIGLPGNRIYLEEMVNITILSGFLELRNVLQIEPYNS